MAESIKPRNSTVRITLSEEPEFQVLPRFDIPFTMRGLKILSEINYFRFKDCNFVFNIPRMLIKLGRILLEVYTLSKSIFKSKLIYCRYEGNIKKRQDL